MNRRRRRGTGISTRGSGGGRCGTCRGHGSSSTISISVRCERQMRADRSESPRGEQLIHGGCGAMEFRVPRHDGIAQGCGCRVVMKVKGDAQINILARPFSCAVCFQSKNRKSSAPRIGAPENRAITARRLSVSVPLLLFALLLPTALVRPPLPSPSLGAVPSAAESAASSRRARGPSRTSAGALAITHTVRWRVGATRSSCARQSRALCAVTRTQWRARRCIFAGLCECALFDSEPTGRRSAL